jgi:hypothetical protein
MENIPENPTTARNNFLSNFPNHRLRIAFVANSASAGCFYVLSSIIHLAIFLTFATL